MPSDRHNELARRGLTWLAARASLAGYKGSTEVALKYGYVADAAAFCHFQSRFWKNYGLKFGDPRLLKLFEVSPRGAICIIESKVSRADFLGTFRHKKHLAPRMEPFGHFHWLVCEKGIVKPEDDLGFWGLFVPSGAGLKEMITPKLIVDIPKENRYALADRLLWNGNFNHWNTTGEIIVEQKRQMLNMLSLIATKSKHGFDGRHKIYYDELREEMMITTTAALPQE